MFDKESLGRAIILLIIGAAVGTIFGLLIAYPALLAESRENAARIESNKERIEQLWEAHYIQHDLPTKNGD